MFFLSIFSPWNPCWARAFRRWTCAQVLAKIFRVQYTEVALLRLEGGLLHFVFPEYLRTTGAIPLSSKAVAAHTALSKKAEIFNNFARVKHASIFETIKPEAERVG